MVKEHTNISIDADLKARAKKRGYNITELTEDAIRAKLGVVEVEVDTSSDEEICKDCGKEQRKATADDMNGLTWLYPNEIWVCNNCLTRRSVVSQ